MQANCDECAHLYYDEDYEEYLCAADMDEYDYARLMNNPRSTCPFYQNGDEYKVVRKQM